MVRMQNDDLSQTQPNQIDDDSSNNASDLGLTHPVNTSETIGRSDLGQTVPLATDLDDEPDAGFEATIHPSDSQTSENLDSHADAPFNNGKPPGAPPTTEAPDSPVKNPFPIKWLVVIGLLGLLLIAAGSTFAGYQSGISGRKSAEATQVSAIADEQYELGMLDMEAKRYDLARQRFEYVIQVNPNYPGVTEQLALVLLEINTTATPTQKPTPTITATPDMRGVEELFVQAQIDLANMDWTNAINTLLSLRKADPNYQPVWVDDMLYVAYRNRGKDKILKDGDLEGGIYDLTQAEQIGPLDVDAKGYLTWSRLYITGASFWEIDWGQAVYYFAQVAPALPNLRDGSGWTATERYRIALIGYGDFLADNKDWCGARIQYELSLSLGTDELVQEKYVFIITKCPDEGESSEQPTQPSEPTPTLPTVENPTPTVPPVVEPTATTAPPLEPTATTAPPPEPTATPIPNPTDTPVPEPTATEQSGQQPSPTPGT